MKEFNPYLNKNFTITQEYSHKHTGIDIVCEDVNDNYVYSVSSGIIDFTGWENSNNHKQGFGQYVRIYGEDKIFYYYGRLNWIQNDLVKGKKIKVGDLIGRDGNTGNSSGIHLHFEIRKKLV